MRRLFIILLFVLTLQAFAQDSIGIGSDFSGVFVLSGEYREEKAMGGWNEVSLTFMGYIGHPTLISAKLEGEEAIPFGYAVNENGKTLYYYDMSFDERIDTVSEKIIPPFWIFFPYQNVKRDPNPQFIEYCDSLYRVLQGPLGPEKDPEMEKISEDLERIKNDTSLHSRDMFYVLWYYLTYKHEFPFTCQTVLNLLISGSEMRYGETHPLIMYYRTVHQIRQGFIANARDSLAGLTAADPDFIPAKFLDYQIGDYSRAEKNKILENLKKQYPGHWMLGEVQ